MVIVNAACYGGMCDVYGWRVFSARNGYECAGDACISTRRNFVFFVPLLLLGTRRVGGEGGAYGWFVFVSMLRLD